MAGCYTRLLKNLVSAGKKVCALYESETYTRTYEALNLNSGFLTQRKQERIHGASI